MLTYGGTTPLTVFLTMEAHKLHLEFDIAAGVSIYKGQQVKLTASGAVTPIAANDADNLKIGVAVMDRPDGATANQFKNVAAGPYQGDEDRITIAMRGYATTQVQAGAALVPGPVKYSGLSAGKIPQYIQSASATDAEGWALDVATAAGDVIKVVLKA